MGSTCSSYLGRTLKLENINFPQHDKPLGRRYYTFHESSRCLSPVLLQVTQRYARSIQTVAYTRALKRSRVGRAPETTRLE